MRYNTTQGAWVKGEELKTGDRIELVGECTLQEGQFKDKEGNPKKQNVAKVRVNSENETKNININWTSINGLIAAYGNESKDWIGKPITADVREQMVGDKLLDVIYLIPEGFEMRKNADKKLEIVKVNHENEGSGYPTPEEEGIDVNDPKL